MLPPHEEVPDFADFGVRAFTTTRAAGSFAWQSTEPATAILARWDGLRAGLREAGVERLATAHQVHGARVLEHAAGWDGLLRANDADGHFAAKRGTAMAVTIADCVPVFIAHPSGAAALLHSGWKGTVTRIVEQGIAAFRRAGHAPRDLAVHLGPSICGQCYEVSPDVFAELTGRRVAAPTPVDLRRLITQHARDAGVLRISTSARCTKCDNGIFFSHRGGDAGRQLAVIAAP